MSFFSKSPVYKMLSVQTKSNAAKSVLEKLRFRDGLVWTAGLTVEIKLYVRSLNFCFLSASMSAVIGQL